MKTFALILLTAVNLCAQNLVWDTNKESDLAGYRVYAGQASGDYSLLQDVGLVTKFALPFKDGLGRFFTVTAYDRSGNESGFADEIFWQAPLENAENEIEWAIDAPVIFVIEYDRLDTRGNPLEPQIELQTGLGAFSPLAYAVTNDTLKCSLASHSIGEHLRFRVRLVNAQDRSKASEWAYTEETLVLIKPDDVNGFPRPVKIFRLVL